MRRKADGGAPTLDSQSSDEDDGCGLEYAFSDADSCISEAADFDADCGNQLVDFI